MSKHTPGPWERVLLGMQWRIVAKVDKEPYPICSLTHLKNEQSRVDATLIAAAPELLANLKGILAWIEDAWRQENPSLPDKEYLRSAYEAIIKAECE